LTITEWFAQFGIAVHDASLLEEAFTHTSYANEHHTGFSNERLEFMGDAVLQLWSSKEIYPLKPSLSEGEMTRLRSRLVREETLAGYARSIGLNQWLRLGSGEEKSGGRRKDAICGDLFEAVLGALYLDSGWDTVDRWLTMIMKKDIRHPADEDTFKDYKSKLQEYVQTDTRRTVRYQLIKEVGPSNAPQFTMNVIVDDLVMGTGSGSSKKMAEQNAAKDAMAKLGKL
jgi:ribonuclease-3